MSMYTASCTELQSVLSLPHLSFHSAPLHSSSLGYLMPSCSTLLHRGSIDDVPCLTVLPSRLLTPCSGHLDPWCFLAFQTLPPTAALLAQRLLEQAPLSNSRPDQNSPLDIIHISSTTSHPTMTSHQNSNPSSQPSASQSAPVSTATAQAWVNCDKAIEIFNLAICSLDELKDEFREGPLCRPVRDLCSMASDRLDTACDSVHEHCKTAEASPTKFGDRLTTSMAYTKLGLSEGSNKSVNTGHIIKARIKCAVLPKTTRIKATEKMFGSIAEATHAAGIALIRAEELNAVS